MKFDKSGSIALKVAAVIAIIFGALTLKSAGLVLFVSEDFNKAIGNFVPFVVWFNGVAAIFYLITGFGLWKQQRWSVWMALTIVFATWGVYALFGLHVRNGGAYEMQTVAAMALRSGVWTIISILAWFKLKQKKSTASHA